MYHLHCRDLNYACDHPGHKVTGNTKEEAWERLIELCRKEHPDFLAETIPDQLESMKQKILESLSADSLVQSGN